MTNSIYSRVIYCFFLSIVFTQGFSQNFYNLDLEYSKPSGYPYTWQTNEGNPASKISVTNSISYSGKNSLQFKIDNSPMSLAGILFSNDMLSGKAVEISGYIKTDSLQKGSAQLFYYDYGKRALVTSEQTSTASSPWTLFTFRFNIDSGSKGEGVVIGVKANGTGTVHFDKAQIRIGNEVVKDKGFPYKELTQAERSALSRLSVSIPAFHSNSPGETLIGLKPMIGTATIVGLGENSHGSGSTFKIKHQLIQSLVSEMGFSVLAMESPAPEADRINHYIQGKGGDIKDVIRYLGFKSWQTKEVMEVLQWLKEYNNSHTNKVQFRGFDIQSKEVAIDTLQAFAKSHDYGTVTSLTDSISFLLAGNPVTDPERRVALKRAESLVGWFDSMLSRQLPVEIKASLTYLRHIGQVLVQHVGLPILRNRREVMAQNIKWIMEHSPPGAKVILWAGNGHISRAAENMGNYLNLWYGEKYLPVAATFFEGTYAAYGKENYYTAELPYLGTVEYYLGKVGHAQYIIDLRALRGQKQNELVKQVLDFRDLGAEPQSNQFRPINVLADFDALIYLKKSEHATYLVQ